jgi:hypothetical protein
MRLPAPAQTRLFVARHVIFYEAPSPNSPCLCSVEPRASCRPLSDSHEQRLAAIGETRSRWQIQKLAHSMLYTTTRLATCTLSYDSSQLGPDGVVVRMTRFRKTFDLDAFPEDTALRTSCKMLRDLHGCRSNGNHHALTTEVKHAGLFALLHMLAFLHRNITCRHLNLQHASGQASTPHVNVSSPCRCP